MLPQQSFLDVLAAPSGQDTYVRIPAPGRGWVHRLRVRQQTGALEGFAYELYSRDVTQPDISADKDLYSFFGEMTLGSGSALAAFPRDAADTVLSLGAALAYINEDDIGGVSANYVVLRINPSGTGNKDFKIALSCSAVTPY